MRYQADAGEDYVFAVPKAAAGMRLDVFLSGQLADPSRSFLKRLIDDDLVRVEPGRAKPSYKLKGGEEVSLFLPEPVELSAAPEDLPLSVLYEDDDLIVLDKAAGMVVHPGPGHERGTLVNALLHRCGDLSGIGGVLRPGIVHRLDRDTTGCLVAAKNDTAHQGLTAQFAERTTEKTYLALTRGVPRPPEGKVEGQIGRHPQHRKLHALLDSGGRYSLTFYKTLERFGDFACVECDIKTGRTHQIRVHLKSIGAPLLCDPEYGKGERYTAAELRRAAGLGKVEPGESGSDDETVVLARTALHARRLAFTHPRSGARMTFEAPLTPDMAAALAALRG